MAKPTIAVRVTTRKGKDMLKLLNGEWAEDSITSGLTSMCDYYDENHIYNGIRR